MRQTLFTKMKRCRRFPNSTTVLLTVAFSHLSAALEKGAGLSCSDFQLWPWAPPPAMPLLQAGGCGPKPSPAGHHCPPPSPPPPPARCSLPGWGVRCDTVLSARARAPSVLSPPGTRCIARYLQWRTPPLDKLPKYSCVSPLPECHIERRSLRFAINICKLVCLPKCLLDDSGDPLKADPRPFVLLRLWPVF